MPPEPVRYLSSTMREENESIMRVTLEDESLRDGLQGESRLFNLTEKLEIVRRLSKAGVTRIQLGSFVHPRSMPQMANTEALVALVREEFPGILSTGLVLNEKGLDRAVRCGIRHISMSVSASESHSRKNVGRPAAEVLETVTGLIPAAIASGIQVRAGVQCAFGCVYEGAIVETAVMAAVERMADAGASEINLADTSGMAHPRQIQRMVSQLRQRYPRKEFSLHLHDARGLGLVNMFAGYEAGVRLFDAAAGGLGGCPSVRGAAGNVATEDAVHLFQGMDVATGVDLELLCEVAGYYESLLERPLPGRMHQVLHSQPKGC